MDFTGSVNQKLGPLPVWTWGVIAGSGVLLWILWRQMTVRETVPTPTYVPDSAIVEQAYLRNGAPIPTVEKLAETNQTWMTSGVAYFTGKGANGTEAAEAFQRYLSGKGLSNSQQNMIDAYIKNRGLPPEGATPVTDTYQSYYRDNHGAIYGVYSDGTTRWLDYPHWIALGKPGLNGTVKFTADDYKSGDPTPEPVFKTWSE